MQDRPGKRKPRVAHESALRRAEISKLYREKLSQPQIAARLGITQQAVSRHIATLNAEARESAETDLFMAQADMLADHYYIYGEALAAWNRSEKTPSDAKHLLICLGSLQAIRAIRGLDAPRKQEIRGSVKVFDASTKDDRELQEAIRSAYGMIPAIGGPLLLTPGNGSNGNGGNGAHH